VAADGRPVQGDHYWRQGFDRLDTLASVDGQHKNDRGDADQCHEDE
jgi:hypothetical protein